MLADQSFPVAGVELAVGSGQFLFRLADRVSVIHWGQVIAQGTPAQLRQNDWVQRSNLGALAA